jgi:dTDP-4-amino-4,6-dideoxygalactose transaminase
MRNFGFAGFDNVIHPGTNGKMVEVCAAMGLANLECVGAVVEVNRRNYHAYLEEFGDVANVALLKYDEREQSNFQYIVLEVSEKCRVPRDEIVKALHAENVLARRYFWPGCHRMLPYRALFPHAGLLLPYTQKVADRVIVLPTGTAVERRDVTQIAAIVRLLVH